MLLNSGNDTYFSDTGFQGAAEICESFYDTLILLYKCINESHTQMGSNTPASELVLMNIRLVSKVGRVDLCLTSPLTHELEN
jgi:hypothetical protein